MALRAVILACSAHLALAARVGSEEEFAARLKADQDVSWRNLVSNLNNARGVGDACESHWCSFTTAMARFAFQRLRLEREARRWSPPPLNDLERPLLAAKLCQASYENLATVEQVVAAEGMQLLEHTDQWWITRKPNGEVWVVFRGTADLHDVLVDVLVHPTEHNGAMWHTGFLHSVQRPHLQEALRRHANSPRVTVVGHSLGGANAFALAASGFMPVGHIEEVITFGAPAVIYEESSDRVNKNFKHTAFANNADPVPRLLGSDPVVLGALLDIFHDQGSRVDHPSQNLLEAVSLYGQEGNAVWLKGSNGRPLAVPSARRQDVMMLQTVMSVTATPGNPLGDHLMAGYRNGIEEEIRSGGSSAPAGFWR